MGRPGSVGRVPHGPVIDSRVSSASYSGESSPAVSVVVATFERCGYLDVLFEALSAQQRSAGDVEVVVVDDCSKDDTWSTLERVAATTSLPLLALRLAENAGQGVARNAGVAHARGPVVAFTDDDCIPTPQWLAELTAPFGGERGKPGAVVVQGRTQPWPGDATGAGPWSRTIWVLRPTLLFETCNIAFRRADLDAAGGFVGRGEGPISPTGRVTGEDVLLGWQVLGAGAELVFCEAALVYHRHLPARFWDWVREQRGKAVFPALVAVEPRVRRAMWRRPFLTRRSAAFDLGLSALVAAVVVRRWWSAAVVAAAAAPWVASAWPDASSRGGRARIVRLIQLLVGDAVGATALVLGSVRHRRAVL